MLTIRNATTHDISPIQRLTDVIWWATYDKILSRYQIEYMLKMMYSIEALTHQMEVLAHRFILCNDDDAAIAFASYSPIGITLFKLHKIYVLPNQQGKGVGRFIIAHIIDAISSLGATALDLNVNRYNPAKTFYERLGFTIIREEDIDIGGGYWMNDYVMRKLIDE